ncbi:MAG: glycosyltransferase [Trueperaceae bacterium]
MNRVRVSVITVTHQRRDLLRRKLHSLEGQSLPPEEFEWIVCDNASDDGTTAALSEVRPAFSLKVVRSEENRGPGPGRNACVRLSDAPILYFSDDDCLLAPDTLERHLQAQTRPGVLVGGIRWEFDGGHEYMRPARVRYWNLHGMNTSLPRAAFDRAGGFDESLTGYGLEDVLLGFRLRQAGYRFRSLPDVLVRHIGANPMRAADPLKARSAGRNAVHIARRYPRLGVRLGVHPLSLGLKKVLLHPPLGLAWRLVDTPSYRYERAYLDAALDELGGRSEDHGRI